MRTPSHPPPLDLIEARDRSRRTLLALRDELGRLAEMSRPEFEDLARRLNAIGADLARIEAELIEAMTATRH